MCGDWTVGESRRFPATPRTDVPGSVQSQLKRTGKQKPEGWPRAGPRAGGRCRRRRGRRATDCFPPAQLRWRSRCWWQEERRQPRARTASPSQAHTPGPAATAYLPCWPASFLSLAGAAVAASCTDGSDVPLTRLRPTGVLIRVRGLQPPRLPLQPPLPPTPLQLLATPLRQLAAPAPSSVPAFGPAPRAPPPSPRQPAPESPPL